MVADAVQDLFHQSKRMGGDSGDGPLPGFNLVLFLTSITNTTTTTTVTNESTTTATNTFSKMADVFLCTMPSRLSHCNAYFRTAEATIQHLIAKHDDIPDYIAAYGGRSINKLPIPAQIVDSNIPIPPTSLGLDVYVCSCCDDYFPRQTLLLRHLEAEGIKEIVIEAGGEEGLLNYIQVDCRRLLLIDKSVSSVANDQSDAVREAILNAGLRRNQLARPVIPADDLANIEPVIPDDLAFADDQPRLAANIQPVIPDDPAVGQPGLAADIGPVIPEDLVTIRVYFLFPLKTGSCTFTLASPCFAMLFSRISELYPEVAKDPKAKISCVEWFRIGVPARYDKKGGGADTTTIFLERHLTDRWAELEFVEMFIGGRKQVK